MPGKEKLPVFEKISLVRRCIFGEIGLNAAAREIEASTSTICRWIARYEAEGAAGFLPQGRNRVYCPELKTQVVADFLSGKGSTLELAKRYKVRNPNLVEVWIRSIILMETLTPSNFPEEEAT